jgi:Predicted transcriptional regulators
MVEKGVVKALQDLGLTEYEARVYTALAKIKIGIASEIHLISGIPRSAVYGALAKLEKRGIVEVQHSKPMRYKVVSPSDALDKLLGTFLLGSKEAFIALEELYCAEDVEEEDDESIWMCRGAKNTHDKILELINAAGEEIDIVAYSVLRHWKIGTEHMVISSLRSRMR